MRFSARRPGAHRRADRGARRPDRQAERQRAHGRVPGRAVRRALHPDLLVLRHRRARPRRSRAAWRRKPSTRGHGRLAGLRPLPGQLRALPRLDQRRRAASGRRSTTRPSSTTRSPRTARPAPGTSTRTTSARADGRRPLRLRRREQRHARLAAAQGAAQLPPGAGDHRLAHGQQGHHVHYAPAQAETAAGTGRRPPRPSPAGATRSYTPPPDATPVPACWRNPSGQIGGGGGGAAASDGPDRVTRHGRQPARHQARRRPVS